MNPRRPTTLAGAVAGILVSAATAGVLYAASHLLPLSFPPFDFFDTAARILPGAIITAGIDTMVHVIGFLGLGPTATVAKAMERATGLAGFVVAGGVAGALLVAWVRSRPGRSPEAGGVLLGLLAGAVGSGAAVFVASTPTWAAVSWNMVVGLVWGWVLGWSVGRLATTAAGAAAVHLADAQAPGVEPVKTTPAQPVRDAAEAVTQRIDRRHFLVRLGGATAVITVAGAVLAEWLGRSATQPGGPQVPPGARPWSATHPLPNADAKVQPAPGTRPELTPVPDHYRIDIDTQPPEVVQANWRLRIGGLVDRPVRWTLSDITNGFQPIHQFITLACISNPVGGDLVGTTRWTGVSVQDVLAVVHPRSEATHLHIRAVDGFDEFVALDLIRSDRRLMLTYAWDGLPLPAAHGFPLRIYVPDVYGMKQPKWIESIEAIDGWEPGYWVRRGWNATARMQTTSVIDTVAAGAAYTTGDGRRLVPVGGIARAGDRGISRVELQMDEGPWQRAELRTPLSDTTWVIWRYDWPFQAGEHTFTVRCVDGTGTPQIERESPPEPSGATGLDHRRARL